MTVPAQYMQNDNQEIEKYEKLFLFLYHAFVRDFSLRLVGMRSAVPLQLGEPAQKKLIEYLILLETWGGRIDLTSPAPPEMTVSRHFLDSIAAHFYILSELSLQEGQAILDVGSGAGFPGMVLGILNPERTVYLCEPRYKRSVFLKEVKRKLELANVKIFEKRIEDFIAPQRPKLGLMVTRATGFSKQFLSSAMTLLSKSGFALEMLSGEQIPKAERIQGEKADELLHWKTFDYRLPPDNAERKIAVWKKFC